MQLFWPRCRTLHLLLLNSMKFLSAHFSSRSKPLSIDDLPSIISTLLPSLLSRHWWRWQECSLTRTSRNSLSTFRCIPPDPMNSCMSSLLNSSQMSSIPANTSIQSLPLGSRSREDWVQTLHMKTGKERVKFLSFFPCPLSLGPLHPQAAHSHSP